LSPGTAVAGIYLYEGNIPLSAVELVM
jgi:hypothetical protein